MNVYAIVEVADDDSFEVITRIEANDLMDARLMSLRYGDNCTAVLENPSGAMEA